MGFFRTKDPKTGEPRLGAGVYLIICALMIGGVVLWNLQQHSHEGSLPGGQGQPAAATSGPKNQTDVSPIAEAVEAHKNTVDSHIPGVADTGVGQKPTDDGDKKIAEEKDDVDTIENTVQILRQNDERARKEKEEAVAAANAAADERIRSLKSKALVSTSAQGGGDVLPNGATSVAAGKGRPGTPAVVENQEIKVDTKSLTVYDIKNDKAQQKPATQTVLLPTGFESNNFLPRGYFFPVYILTTIQTVNQEDIIIMGVAENVIFQHKVQIPFGTRLLGTASNTNFQDRVAVNVDTILYPDGRELPISAFLKDASDLSTGVRGYYIPQPLYVQLAPFVSQFISDWTQAVTQRYAGSGSTVNPATGQLVNTGVSNSSTLIIAQATKIQQRLDQRYPEMVVVPIGTKAYVQIRSPLDLTLAKVAGSLSNTQPVLPGFQNNPISPSGVVEREANTHPATGQVNNGAQQPAAAAANQPVQPDPAAQAAAAAEAQNYMNSLKQLNELQKQISGAGGAPGNTAQTNPSPAVNWPSGDIQ